MSIENLHYYDEKEEKLNVISHALGVFLFGIALFALAHKSLEYNTIQSIGLMIYGFSQVMLYSASTFYHAQKSPRKRYLANIIDHAMIYVSIAGTYTPFCLISLANNGGISLLIFVWSFALMGVLIKIKFTGKFNLLSTIVYLFMGWIVIFYWREFLENIPQNGINLLVLGGIFFTIGAVFYMLDKIKFNHSIFHFLILLGSISHFLAIYFYI